MIDFNSTYDNGDVFHFVNKNDEVVKTYKMSELEQYVLDCELNILQVSLNGKNQFDPECEDGTEEIDPIDYINENWFSITEAFYMDRNKSEFKSGNGNYPYAKQGIYSIQPATKSK